jgi:phenylacetate-CoA ligase
VAERTLTAAEEDALRGAILGALHHPFAISFTYFNDRIPRGANGKFEEFICKV